MGMSTGTRKSRFLLLRKHFQQAGQTLVTPLLAIGLAILLGAVIILATGGNPVKAYYELFAGAFGSFYDLTETIVSAIPLMLAGLSIAFAYRCGLFNIGAEGQLYIGAIASTWVGVHLTGLPGFVLLPLALLAGAAAGAIWAGIPGVLKARTGAHEVITTMMFTYVALSFSQYLLERNGPLQEKGFITQSEEIARGAQLPSLGDIALQFRPILGSPLLSSIRLHAGLVLALGGAFIFWYILWRTTTGYEIRAVGLSPKAARYAGINIGKNIILTMCIAGAYAGLAGSGEVLGVLHRLVDNFSNGIGFDSIGVALLGRTNPVGVLLAALLFGAMRHGANAMQANAGVSVNIISVLQALVLFFIALETLFGYLKVRMQPPGTPAVEKKEVVDVVA